LSKVAKGLLLLTATPEQLGVESHFARLRLLDPERYSEYHTFINESREHREIANVVEALADGKPMKPADKKITEALLARIELPAYPQAVIRFGTISLRICSTSTDRDGWCFEIPGRQCVDFQNERRISFR
jgi:hypothetical protein